MFSELEPHHGQLRAATETAERLAAYQAYPARLERIAAMGGSSVEAPAGPWVLAPEGRRAYLAPIAAAARDAEHDGEEHDAAQIWGLRAPSSSAGALWLPTEARVDSAALMEALSRAVERHQRSVWSHGPATSVSTGAVVCADGATIGAREVVLTG
jgi:glycine oxidase